MSVACFPPPWYIFHVFFQFQSMCLFLAVVPSIRGWMFDELSVYKFEGSCDKV